MKKFLAIALTVVMVIGVASSAMAFKWVGPAAKTDAQAFGYKVDVIKFTRSTGSIGSSSFNIDSTATAVNGADVYFAVKVTVPDLDKDKAVRKNAKLEVKATGINVLSPISTESLANYDAGIYYVYPDGKLHTVANGSPVFVLRCLDTDTANVSAKITSEFDLSASFVHGDYEIEVTTNEVTFYELGSKSWLATFKRNIDGKVLSVEDSGGDSQKVLTLYRWLDSSSADAIYEAIDNDEMYMTNANLRAAFGWSYKNTSTASWNASSTPITLDPNLSIPKTGDNASVIGFAMIMVAIVAAVAVKKVKA